MKLPKRIEDKIDRNGPNGCWLWTGALFRNGYGEVHFEKKQRLAHRVVYQLIVGPIPDDLQIDHLCRVRSCVNPSHMELVTQEVNIQRGLTGDHQRRKTHCPKGHPYDEANTYIYPSGRRAGWRECKICRTSNMKNRPGRRKSTGP